MAKVTFEELCTTSRDQLEELMKTGTKPTFASICGWEFAGFNRLAFHERVVMSILGNTRFCKCFFVDKEAHGDVDRTNAAAVNALPYLKGYNLKVTNGSYTDPWTTVPNEEKPNRVGRYKVYATRNRPGANLYPHGVFFDYRQPENNLFSGSTIDDYMVQPDAENPDLLLGKAYTALGIMTPSTFFILKRHRLHDR
jgi:hypothetical protein